MNATGSLQVTSVIIVSNLSFLVPSRPTLLKDAEQE